MNLNSSPLTMFLLKFLTHFRYGLAKEKLGDFQHAKRLLLEAKARSPQDSSITRSLLEVNIYKLLNKIQT